MTDMTISDQGAVRLQAVTSVPSVPDALTGLPGVRGFSAASGVPGVSGVPGLEARPALLTLVTPGGAPVCEGDACLIDAGSFAGAEGDWSEVPD
ncbi:hypothetical protein DEI98_17860 [Curtobacterium sp. MCLR17_034]|nr:hypothetical protein DEI98_17860 [Curtobacterium sp. MCLR17_034]